MLIGIRNHHKNSITLLIKRFELLSSFSTQNQILPGGLSYLLNLVRDSHPGKLEIRKLVLNRYIDKKITKIRKYDMSPNITLVLNF